MGRTVRALLGPMAFMGLLFPADASAFEINLADGELTGNLDTTVSIGGIIRVADRDGALIGVQNGGEANSINNDDGNLNFESGDITSFVGKATHELLLDWRNFSFFGRGFYFYDLEYADGQGARTDYSERAEAEAGRDWDLLDAYVAADFALGANTDLTVRAGNQVLSWGESTFIQNGINTLSPVEVSKLRVAGAELREALTAVPTIQADISFGGGVSVGAFYQLYFEHTEVEAAGTYFSTNDFASPGGEFVLLGFGQPGVADDPIVPGGPPPVGASVPRLRDRDAKDDGQFGVAVRYFATALNDTEFGFYFTRLHSRLPVLNAIAGTQQGLGDGDYASSARYFRMFPEDVDTFGLSFNTELGATGTALQGEVMYRRDQPLQYDDVELLFAALTPVSPAFAQNQIGVFGFGEEIQGWKRQDMVQAQATVTRNLGPQLGGNQMIVLGEFGVTTFPDLEDQSEQRYEGPGTYTSGNPFFTDAGLQPATQIGGFADKTSWGYRIVARNTYNNALGPINLVPQIAWAHDASGTTPTPVVNFIDGRKTVTVSVTASYLLSYSASLAYTNSFGGDEFNLLNDRDFVSLSLGYSF